VSTTFLSGWGRSLRPSSKQAVQSSLELATEHGCRQVAFPAISCGVYGYPVDEATEVAMRTVVAYLEAHVMPEDVTFICFEESIFDAYELALKSSD
jgi:O-acetyl-ADP-ribose deacetylase (regulator of RNase III)